MRFVQVTALAVLPSLALLSSNAYAADSCWHPHEAKAAQLRNFHTMLMVGTLQCRGANPEAIIQYNEFVTKHRGALDANASILETRFLREEGIQQGQAAYDRFATSRANGHSTKASEPSFCGNVDGFMRMATAASQVDLLILAQSLSPAPSSGSCPSSHHIAAGPEATANDVAIAVPAIAGEAMTTPKLAASPAEDKTPTTGVASASAAPASRDDALKAAVAALQSAAIALQAASASGAPKMASDGPAANPVQTMAAVKVEDAPVVPPSDVTEP